MASPVIEPGLLRILTWYVGIRLGFGLLVLMSVRSEPDPADPRFPGFGVFFFGLLLIVLVWRPLRTRLGRLFLPLVIVLATLGPIAESSATIVGRLGAGLSPNDAVDEVWVPFFLLWVPLLIVAWQYRYRAVIVWSAVTTFLDLLFTAGPLEEAGADLTLVAALIFARGMLFLFVGLFVAKLVKEQKTSRRVLADHASMLDELATSRERNRLARELHDTLAHSLSAVAVQLEAVKSLWDSDPDRAHEMLEQALAGSRSGLAEARRAIQALRASPLEELGLGGALDQLGAGVEARSALEVDVDVTGDLGEVAPDVEQAIYRIADEAMTNVVRHANASRLDVSLDRAGRWLQLEVADDGDGFDTKEAPPNGHVGLQGMAERAEVVQGLLKVKSKPGEGTTVAFEVEAPR